MCISCVPLQPEDSLRLLPYNPNTAKQAVEPLSIDSGSITDPLHSLSLRSSDLYHFLNSQARYSAALHHHLARHLALVYMGYDIAALEVFLLVAWSLIDK